MAADGLSYASCYHDIILDYHPGDLQHSKKNNIWAILFVSRQMWQETQKKTSELYSNKVKAFMIIMKYKESQTILHKLHFTD